MTERAAGQGAERRAASRRDRIRQETVEEIHAAARRLLTTKGSAAVTINAVAREVGMSGPALYHYYAGHEALVGAVTAGFFQELAEEMAAARDAHAQDPPVRRLLATCRAMRAWATAHPDEFGWVFASPIAAANREPDSDRQRAGREFERVLLEQVAQLWAAEPFPAPDLADLDPSLRGQLNAYSKSIDGLLPPEAVHTYLACWTRLYGLLCMEVLHQLDFAYTDFEPVFEECLRDVCTMVGLEYTAA